MKILLNITHGFQARMLLRSGIEKHLADNGADIVVVSPNADEPYFKEECQKLGFAVESIDPHHSIAEKLISNTRSYFLMNPSLGSTMHHKRDLYKKNYPIRHYTTRAGNLVLGRVPALRKGYLKGESRLFPGKKFDHILEAHKPDLAVSGTPGFSLLDAHLLRSAKRLGIPSTTVMLSWDNLTSKGYMSAQPDSLLTWSTLMMEEARHYHDFNGPIFEAGAAQFDIYKHHRGQQSKADFKKKLGVPEDKPLIVFGTINASIYPKQMEALKTYIDTLAKWDTPPTLWARLHPQSVYGPFEHLKEEYLKLQSDDVIVEIPKVRSKSLLWDLPRKDMEHLADLMFAADVMVTPQSTLTIDAACADTPIINLGIEPSFRKVFKYTHYQNITKHHAVWIADTYDELEKATRTYIDSASRHQEGRKAVVKEQLGNYLGQAAKRSADLLCQLAND